jgi:pimeloyl-ACP methyl ester carboxylesterase
MVTVTDPATTNIQIPIGGGLLLQADLTIPPSARGVVFFAHGSGSSRLSPRNRYVASGLNSLNIGTVLADLLTAEEEQLDARDGTLRFNIPLLTNRLVNMIDWARGGNAIPALPIGLFGASTGAAAALDAAAARSEVVVAVVSRGGRPDLAARLGGVRAPVLLIVGGNDFEVIQMNRWAFRHLDCEKELKIIPGATHLFEETGTLEAAAAAAGAWFQQYLIPAAGSSR